MLVDLVGIAPATASRLGIGRRLRSALAPAEGAVRRCRVALTDENGPKGGVAVRCTVDVRLTRRAPIHAEGRGTSAALALREALERVRRTVRDAIGASRVTARHPKKYFAAARAAAGVAGKGRSRASRRS